MSAHGCDNFRSGRVISATSRLLWSLCVKLLPFSWLLLAGCVASGYNFPMPRVLPNLRITVLFFGRVRELTGLAEESLDMPAGATLADLFDRYAQRFPKLASFRASLVASQNEEFAAWNAPLAEHDTIAFLPPVSGG
jgi:molybdopterin synthase sulfur carrier subunit